MNRSDIIVRDVRVKTHFTVDDEYLNGYAKLCGGVATMVYLCLCRHADSGQKSFPSLTTMSEKTGMSVSSVQRGLSVLVEFNLIVKGKHRNPETGRWWNNTYMLLDKSVWKKNHRSLVTAGQKEADHRSPVNPTTGHPRPTKDTHNKDSHKRIGLTSKEVENPDKKIEDVKAALVSKGILR